MAFGVRWGIGLLVALVFAVLPVIGLADGSVSSFNMLLWLTIPLVPSGALRGAGRCRRACPKPILQGYGRTLPRVPPPA